MKKVKMGFIVNPIAGMGGSVGLKGTDGDAYRLSLARGAKPVSPTRALEFLNSINTDKFEIHVADGPMGLNVVERSRHRDKVVKTYGPVCGETSRFDTIRIAKLMVRETDILVFVGGDGTARDICEAVGGETPVLGVPSGVKMYSAVFALNPRVAAKIFESFVEENYVLVDREVVDVDEESFRRDVLRLSIRCYLKTPIVGAYVQPSKSLYIGLDEEENKEAIARFIVENMEKDTLYILGPGSTVKAIAKLINQPYTLLGVDALFNGEMVKLDLWEKDILELIEEYGKVKLVLTPIGGQGFILGRGNQQLTPKVVRKIGLDNIILVSTLSKIQSLDVLRVDTGDPDLDRELCRFVKVLVDYNQFVVRKIVCE